MPYFERGGLRLHYTERGEGPAVVWHTGGCGDASMWETAGYIDTVPGFRHILFDHRGHGQSDSPQDLNGHAMREYVDDVVALMDAAGIDTGAIVGYSLGARVAYAAGIAHPDRISAIVGLDSVPAADHDPDSLRAGAASIRERGTRAVITEMAANEDESPPQWLVEHLCSTSAEVFAGGYEAFATFDAFWSGLGDLRAPTLFLVGYTLGDEDYVKRAARAAHDAPAGQSATLDGLGHLQAFWRTDVTLPVIRRFLTERRAAI